MWQLSFPISTEAAIQLNKLSPKEMQNEVLRRCGHWHQPFPSMVQDTPLNTIWGTSLLDRDPQQFIDHRRTLEIHGRIPSRVVVLGDAAHSMSPFKGQGANQAMADGPLLASWLVKSRVDSAVRGFMTEMSRRSGIKVRASREAARRLHCGDCWDWMVNQDQKPSKANGDGDGVVRAVFHGVQPRYVAMLLRILKERGMGADLGSKLDDSISGIIRELNIGEDALQPLPSSPTNNKKNNACEQMISAQEMTHLQSQALQYASSGNMSQLRELSRKSHVIIPKALNNHQQTCLHLAAQNAQVDVCRWLLSEVNVDANVLDVNGKRAIDLVSSDDNVGHVEVVRLVKRWMDQITDTSAKAVDTSNSNDYDSNSKSVGRSNNEEVKDDVYRLVEQQLRGIRTVKQLRKFLQKNRDTSCQTQKNDHAVTHVLGCHLDESDRDYDRQCMKALAEDHGAVLLRSFIPREVDQLALGVMALRPMNFDLCNALKALRTGIKDECFDAIATIDSKDSMLSKQERKRTGKRIEEVKSELTVPIDASIIVQTNFGPQIQSYYSPSEDNQTKKRKVIDSLPLSRLRYINLGEWNYNWGDRKYEKVPNAMVLPNRLVSLARRAHAIAKLKTNNEGESTTKAQPVSFDMAICNLYHLQRPSDRLGGHQDNVESDISLPLVTVSLGAPGIFLLGGRSRQSAPTAILLRAGDCMVMSGNSRGYFHGIPAILSNDELDDTDCNGPAAAAANNSVETYRVFPELNESGHNTSGASILQANAGTKAEGITKSDIPTLDEMRFVKAFLTSVRMNMSVRRV